MGDGRIQSAWPERWSVSRIKAKVEELGGWDAKETKKQLRVEPTTDEDTTFDEAGIRRCLLRGVGVPANCESLEDVRTAVMLARPRTAEQVVECTGEFIVVHGLDIGGRRNSASGKTVLTSLAIHPDGTRQPFRIAGRRIGGPEIRDLIVHTHELFGGVFVIENNATQQWILDFTREVAAIPMIPFTTGTNKVDPTMGVETLSIEFNSGNWVLPCTQRSADDLAVDEELSLVLDGLRDYSPEAHTSDYVMSLWLAREGARRLTRRKAVRQGDVGVRVFGASKPGKLEDASARSQRRSQRRKRDVIDAEARWRE